MSENYHFIVSSVAMANALHENRLIWGMDVSEDVGFKGHDARLYIEGSKHVYVSTMRVPLEKALIVFDGRVNVGLLIKLHRLLKSIEEQPVTIIFDSRKDITITCQL